MEYLLIDKNKIIRETLSFLKLGNPSLKAKKIPLNSSLLKLGLVDSFGVIEIVTFLEKKYNISIDDKEITYAKFGSINKMAILVLKKLKFKL